MYYQSVDCRVLGRQPTKVIIGVHIELVLAFGRYEARSLTIWAAQARMPLKTMIYGGIF